jgi:hypothetical protein
MNGKWLRKLADMLRRKPRRPVKFWLKLRGMLRKKRRVRG